MILISTILVSCALCPWAPRSDLLPLATVWWGSFCGLLGVQFPSWPPFLCLVVCLRVLGLGRAFLAVGLSLVSCFVSSRVWLLSGSSLWCFCCAGVFACVSAGVFSLAFVCLSWCGGASLRLSFSWLLSAPPPSLFASLPPVVGPLWRPGPVSVLVPPCGYLVAFATARLPCLNAWGVVVLCRPHFILSHGSKGLWPCVGFVLPSTPCCMCCCGALYSYAEVFIC